jgi:hypothetical protein
VTAASPTDRAGRVVLGMVVGAWAVVLAAILGHRVFVSHDSLSNYAHVWYVQHAWWHEHRLPFAMPVIGHGHGVAFPYASLPWVAAALTWPLLGERSVTFVLVSGFVATAAATRWAFPELGAGWWMAAALVSPPLVMAPIIGQLPFLWGAALLLAAVALWRRGHPLAAALTAAVAQATHPVIVLPIALVLVGAAALLRWEPRRSELLRWWALSAVLAAPAVLIALLSPVFTDASRTTILVNFAATLAVRSLVVAVPLGLAFAATRRPRFGGPAAVVLLIALNVAAIRPFDLEYAWKALRRQPNTTVEQFTATPLFVRGATYRILRAGDGKVGMYQLVQGGARLDSEFFPESIDRRSFADLRGYDEFLRRRHVDFVMVFDTYDRKYRTNEHRLAGAVGVLVARHEHYEVFDVRAATMESRRVSTTNAASASVRSEWTGRQTWRAQTSSATGTGPWATSANTGSRWSGRA